MTPSGRDTLVYAALTLLCGLLLFAFEIHDHGRTLDDLVQRSRGEATLRYVTSLDRAHLPARDLEDFSRGDRLYGPLGATTAVAFGRLLAPLVGDVEEQRHLEFHAGLTLWFLVLFFATLCLGHRYTASRGGAVAAGLALLGMPRVLGLATCNPSDLPAAGAAALSVLLLIRWLEVPRWSRAVACMAGLGGAAAVRAQNGSLLVLVAAAFLVPWLVRRRNETRVWPQLVAAPFLAYGFWVLFWPDFWHAPFTEPWSVLSGFLEKGDRYTQGTLWFGEPTFGPKLYPLVWLAITTPLWILAAAAIGLAACRRHPLVLGLIAWLAISSLKHLSGLGNFGGIRHFLDAFVPIAIFASAGTIAVVRRIWPTRAAWVAAMLATFAVAFARSLHPYESSYFNALGGGTRGAVGRFDLEPNGAQFLTALRQLRPRLDADCAILVPGLTDLVHQVPLPNGVLVHEVLPGNLHLLQQRDVRALLEQRRVFVVTVQDRQWGLFDAMLADGVLETIVATGAADLPVNLVMRVRSAEFYDRVGELFR